MAEAERKAVRTEDWVEVTDEPHHQEIFNNEHIRVYIAVIRPGRETLYHRHDKDTLYVVLQGGRNYSTTLPGSKGVDYVFPKSISLTRKIKWLLTRTIFGWTYLPKSIYLLMHNDGNPIVHKVRGSADNPYDMRMMGIEFLRPGGQDRSLSIGTKPLAVDYEDDTVRVHRLKFPSDRKHIEGAVRFMGILIALKGTIRIEASAPNDSEVVTHDLKEGNLLWNDCTAQLTFSTPEGSESEVLVILMM
jgi:hypothetical protein